MKKVFYSLFLVVVCSLGGIVGLLLSVPLWKGIIISLFGCIFMTVVSVLSEYLLMKLDERAK